MAVARGNNQIAEEPSPSHRLRHRAGVSYRENLVANEMHSHNLWLFSLIEMTFHSIAYPVAQCLDIISFSENRLAQSSRCKSSFGSFFHQKNQFRQGVCPFSVLRERLLEKRLHIIPRRLVRLGVVRDAEVELPCIFIRIGIGE